MGAHRGDPTTTELDIPCPQHNRVATNSAKSMRFFWCRAPHSSNVTTKHVHTPIHIRVRTAVYFARAAGRDIDFFFCVCSQTRRVSERAVFCAGSSLSCDLQGVENISSFFPDQPQNGHHSLMTEQNILNGRWAHMEIFVVRSSTPWKLMFGHQNIANYVLSAMCVFGDVLVCSTRVTFSIV